MEAINELLEAGCAQMVVYWSKKLGKTPHLNNYQYASSQCVSSLDIPMNLLSAILPSALWHFLGLSWWLAMLISYGTSLSLSFMYSIVRDSQIYFVAPSLASSSHKKSSVIDTPSLAGQLIGDNATPYSYEGFKHAPLVYTGGFRCLLLKSAVSKDAIIECQLFDISTKVLPIYEALSYSWENQVPSETILCDNMRFLVTPTCMEALKQLRRRRVGRLLWIDAICIDQTKDGEEERNQQIKIMGYIYAKAAKVIVWFGPSTPESILVFQYLHFCIQLVPLPLYASDWITKRLLHKIRSRGHGDYIRSISRTSWYSRIWTVQEVAMAKRGCCTIICGNDTINYDHAGIGLFDMATTLHLYDDYSLNDLMKNPEKDFRSEMRGIVLLKKSPSGRPIPDMMRFLLNYHSTNPRDKLFGLYGIFKEAGFYMPEPNYANSLDFVYWSGVVALLSQEPTLGLLPLASGVDSHIPGAPSWIPDFRKTDSLIFDDGFFKAGGESLSELEISTGGLELQVPGKIIDTVVDIANWTVWEPPFGANNMVDSRYFGLDNVDIFRPTILAFQDFLSFSMARDTNLRYSNQDMYKVLKKTITRARLPIMEQTGREYNVWVEILMTNQFPWNFLDGENLELYLSKAKADPEMKRRYFDNPELQPLTELPEWQIMCAMKMDPNAARCLHLVWAVSRGNTFFSTKEGYLGNGSNKVVVGDKIALIQGLRSPMILRPVKTQSDIRYMVVGPSYVHGVMNGELWEQDEVESLVLI